MHALRRLTHRSLAAALVTIVVGCAGPIGSPLATPTSVPSGSHSASPSAAASLAPLTGIRLEQVVSGLKSPIGITSAGDGSGRLFVNEQGGQIRVVEADRTLREQPLIDLSKRLEAGG